MVHPRDRMARLVQPAASRRRWRSPTLWIVLSLLLLLPSLLLAECSWLRSRQQARTMAWANEKVAEKIALARARLGEQNWNEAIHHLEEALAEEKATNRDEAWQLLEEAQRGQADSFLNMAKVALKRQEINNAFGWLDAYLAHPHAQNLEQARLLRADLERAVSDDEAARLLAQLSEGELVVFQKDGQLTVNDGFHTLAVRAIFQQTLQRNLSRELRKRQAQRESERLTRQLRAAEHARRVARLRQTRAFQSLTAFISQTLAQSRAVQLAAQQQEAELQLLFDELNVNDPAEQANIRAELIGRDDRLAPRESAERKRAETKRDYRNSEEFEPADRTLFDQLVDEEVNRFLKTLPSS